MTDIKITTRELTKEYKPYGLEQNKKIAKMVDILLKWQEMIWKKI